MSNVTRVSLWGLVNAYLVREDDGLTLVDTTLARGSRRILAAAEELGAPIRRIALTHAHGDHIGGLDRLRAELPDAEVIISTRDARLLVGDKSLDPDEPQSKLRGDYRGAHTAPTRTVADGERIGSLLVLASPGHTPGHVAFLDEREGTLLCGDAYSTLGGVETAARANPRFPLVAMATWNRPTALESARRLAESEPTSLAPGHGRILASPQQEMQAAISRAA
jgi:glyoxylase-like metal-dependent hydrolase (beta-lactamase superfamily II)